MHKWIKDKSKNTAIARKYMSVPARKLHKDGLLRNRILDYGCGKGRDVEELEKLGYTVKGFDPNHAPKMPRGRFRTVLLTYVVNVVEDGFDVMKQAWKKVAKGGLLVVTSRTDTEIKYEAKKNKWKKHNAGYLTKSGTFQRGISSPDLAALGRDLPEASVVWIADKGMICIRKQ